MHRTEKKEEKEPEYTGDRFFKALTPRQTVPEINL